MPELGYRLEDRPGAPSAWKPDDPALLKREAAERQRTKLAVQRKKIEQTLKLKQTVRARSPAVPRVLLSLSLACPQIPDMPCLGHTCLMFSGGVSDFWDWF